MPKVKLLTSMAGINFSHNQGDIIDCNEAEAVRFINAGIAEVVEQQKPKPKMERATKKVEVETAVKED